MVISSQENRKVAAKSPFKINRELVKILGAEPHGVTKQRSGDLMVELRSKEQERKLERVSSFLDIPVTVRPHKSLNTSRGVIKHVGTGPSTRGEKRMIPTACLSRVKQYKAAKDRYFYLAASSVPLPFVLPVVLALSSSSSYLLLSPLVGALLAVRCDP